MADFGIAAAAVAALAPSMKLRREIDNFIGPVSFS
jgi:hypothetical protein